MIKTADFRRFLQRVKKVRFVLTKGYGPLRAAAPTGSFLAVICVIMVKNTVTHRIFRRKSGETGPQTGTKLSKRTQRSGSLTVSKSPEACFRGFFYAFRRPPRSR